MTNFFYLNFLVIYFFTNKCSFCFNVSYEYFSFISYSLICLLISCLLILIPYFLNGRKIKEIEKISEYECGFEPFDNATRQPFTIHFYIVGILFLIFDVEIVLLFP
jgi:NADH:ubiquinone oxidoreductase subunit 3 (subunit A)